MRIALLPSAYAPAIGGVEELTARLAHRLVTAGDEVEVWTNRHPHDLPERDEIGGLTVRRFEMPLPRMAVGPLLRFPLARRRGLAKLADAAAEFRPDILHVQCFSANGVYATWLSRRLGIPLVVSLQGETVMDDHDIYERSLALRLGLRAGLRQAGAVTGCSRFVLADAEQRFGLPPGDGEVIPNGVELEEHVQPEPLDLPFERFVLGLGRIVEKKGFDLLLDAFARLADRHPDLGLVIGGDGPARALLTGECLALPGRLSRGQVAWAMENAAVFVLPSRMEPFGIVILEALRAGCPVVVSSRGGATEIVRDGEDGLVVDPMDTAALATAIDRLLTEPELAARLRAAGLERTKAFDWQAIARRYRLVYSTQCAGHT